MCSMFVESIYNKLSAHTIKMCIGDKVATNFQPSTM